MNIKPNTHYKVTYSNENEYDIFLTGEDIINGFVYIIASKVYNLPIKNERSIYGRIGYWTNWLNTNDITCIEELSEGDVLLEKL